MQFIASRINVVKILGLLHSQGTSDTWNGIGSNCNISATTDFEICRSKCSTITLKARNKINKVKNPLIQVLMGWPYGGPNACGIAVHYEINKLSHIIHVGSPGYKYESKLYGSICMHITYCLFTTTTLL